MLKAFIFSTFFPALAFFCFDDGRPSRCEVVAHCGLVCVSLMISDVEQYTLVSPFIDKETEALSSDITC